MTVELWTVFNPFFVKKKTEYYSKCSQAGEVCSCAFAAIEACCLKLKLPVNKQTKFEHCKWLAQSCSVTA